MKRGISNRTHLTISQYDHLPEVLPAFEDIASSHHNLTFAYKKNQNQTCDILPLHPYKSLDMIRISKLM
jgi:hypothetical protein